ncbi:MAG TPA: hypothetical protein VEX15_18365 [Nocardioidaceae bacterium]|nr:hypothetical protein [Nocardioidaceae bacterium]
MPTPPRVIEYTIGTELPSYTLTWNDHSGTLIDFSTGHTFELRIATPTTTTKSTGIVGAGTAPNVTISLTAGEWDSLTAGTYNAQLWARRTVDNKDRMMPLKLKVSKAIS